MTGDRVQLQQTVLNLLLNAMEAMARARGASGRSSSGPRGPTPGRSGCRCRMPGRGCAPAARIWCSSRSTRRSRPAWAWGWRSPTRSSTPMVATSGSPTTRPGARRSLQPAGRGRAAQARATAQSSRPALRRRPAVLPRLRPARPLPLAGVSIGPWSHGGRVPHRAAMGPRLARPHASASSQRIRLREGRSMGSRLTRAMWLWTDRPERRLCHLAGVVRVEAEQDALCVGRSRPLLRPEPGRSARRVSHAPTWPPRATRDGGVRRSR